MKKHAIKIVKLDIGKGNVIEAAMPVGARIIGGHCQVENSKLALGGRGAGIVPAITVYFDPGEQRMETRRLVVIKTGAGGGAAAIEYSDELAPLVVIVRPGSGETYAVFEAAVVPSTPAELDGAVSPIALSGALDGGGLA